MLSPVNVFFEGYLLRNVAQGMAQADISLETFTGTVADDISHMHQIVVGNLRLFFRNIPNKQDSSH